jgi:addiction module HigA family antidote
MAMSRTPIHPGEILGDELKEIGITGAALSRQIKVPENRVPQIIAGKRSITADTALRLGKWFGTTPAFWLNLQKSYELRKAVLEIGKEIDTIPTRAKEPA